MPKTISLRGSLVLALLLTVGVAAAQAACLGVGGGNGGPTACGESAAPQRAARLRFDDLALTAGLLAWVSSEAGESEDAPLPFTGIEIESVVKPTSIDVAAAVIAELRPGVEVSANVTYFDDEYLKEVQGVLGLGVTF